MRSRYFFPISLAVLLAFFVAPLLAEVPAVEQPLQDIESVTELAETVAIVDQAIPLDTKPAKVLLLIETSPGEVKHFPAVAIPVMRLASEVISVSEYRLGAKVPYHQIEGGPGGFRFLFLIENSDGQHQSTEVFHWTKAKLRSNSRTLFGLKEELARAESELSMERTSRESVEQSLDKLRTSVSRIAGVDELVEKKLELSRLENEVEQKIADKARLEALIELGRSEHVVPGVDQVNFTLTEHLKEAAKVSSIVERLNRRRSELAQQRFDDKLALVKEVGQVDPKRLAEQVLALRRERRQLEVRLNMGASDRGY